MPIGVSLLDEGFLVAVCEQRSEHARKTIVQIYGLGTELLGQYEHAERITGWCPINRIHATAMIALSYEDSSLVLLEAANAVVMHKSRLSATVKVMTYDAASNMLSCANAEKQILTTEIDY
jgi:hypothetical protein